MLDGNGNQVSPPEENGVWLDATAWDLLCQYATASASAKMWADAMKDAKEALVKILGNATYGHYRGQRVVTVIRTRPMRFNQRAFSEAHPGLWDAFREAPAEDEVRLKLGNDTRFDRPKP